MTEPLTAAQMRAIETAAIESGDVTGLELMERAGRGVVEAAFAEWPDLAATEHRAVVLCGPGNNGGDGFVVARLLTERGWEVEVFLYGDADKLPPDARVNHERLAGLGEIGSIREDASLLTEENSPDPGVALYVDALLGTGLTRAFTGLPTVQEDLNRIAKSFRRGDARGRVLAVDIPSGLSSDDGNYPGYVGSDPIEDCIVANLTVTFHDRKIGHLRNHGPVACGHVVVADIGLGPWDGARENA